MQKPCSRTVTDSGNGTKSVSIPKGLADAFDVEVGDDLAIDHDFDEATLTVRLDEKV